jgi:hypothetical protein
LRQFWSRAAVEKLSGNSDCYALFEVAPEPENFHYPLFLEHLIHQTMLNIGAA